MSRALTQALWEAPPDCTASELLLLHALADEADEEGRASLTLAALSRRLRLTTRQVRRLLRTLEQAGQLTTEVNPRACNAYRILATESRLRPEYMPPFATNPQPAIENGRRSGALQFREREGTGAEPAGVRSGFLELDALTGGFRPQSLTIVGARTGVGKSALLLDLARHAARDQQLGVAHFSNELSTDEILTRLLARDARVPAPRLAPGHHDQEAEDRIILAAGRIAEDAITIFDEASATVPEIRAHCRRLQVQDRLDLVLIDYLQLLRGATAGRESRAYELAEITRALKELARDLRVPVIAAAQLNRDVEARPSRIPRLSDLRESGAIEQDADLVLLLHRSEPPSHEEGGGLPGERATDRIQLYVAKNRHGPRGAVPLRFDDRLVSFHDWVEREPEAGERWWSD